MIGHMIRIGIAVLLLLLACDVTFLGGILIINQLSNHIIISGIFNSQMLVSFFFPLSPYNPYITLMAQVLFISFHRCGSPPFFIIAAQLLWGRHAHPGDCSRFCHATTI